MLYPLIIAVVGIVPTWILFRAIERRAERLAGGPLPLSKRVFIPLPIILLLVGNLDGVLSLDAYMQAHPDGVPIRYPGNKQWDADRFPILGFVFLGLQPFFLGAPLVSRAVRLLPVTWVGHLIWMLFPYCPLLLLSGVPLQD